MSSVYVTPGHPVKEGSAGADCNCGECLSRRSLQAQQLCSLCESPAQQAPAGSLPLCNYHNPGGEPVSAAEHLERCTPAQCANCGRPARADYAYSSTICEQWPLCEEEQ